MPSTVGLLNPTPTPHGDHSEAHVDAEGRVVLPGAVAARLGLAPGMAVQIDEDSGGVRLRRSVLRLAKLYVEPTNRCNINCRTCIRNVWDEPLGRMDLATFTGLLDSLRTDPPGTVFFGGYGEPLSHPDIVAMVRAAKGLGARVELITNATLLDAALAQALIDARLDVLWTSLDGATPDSYTDVRLGAALPDVLANLRRFRDRRTPSQHPTPELGIVFVAMRRNVRDLPDLLRLARELGAARFMVSNIMPHTPAMRDEVLYARALSNGNYLYAPELPGLLLPIMDQSVVAEASLADAWEGNWHIAVSGETPGVVRDRCPFIESGSVAVSWNGDVSPCLPLMHSYTAYLHGYERHAERWVVGNVRQRPLPELWRDPAYVAFRRRVQAFDFAPCAVCDGCVLSEHNEEDCYGNAFPTCGGCLWAQGIVQCP